MCGHSCLHYHVGLLSPELSGLLFLSLGHHSVSRLPGQKAQEHVSDILLG